MSDLYQTADWKAEKHVPAIDAPSSVAKGEAVSISITVGKEIPHPNTTEHHIRWIKAIFWADGAKFPVELGVAEFTAHGESAEGPNKGGVYTDPKVIFAMKTDKPGKIIATSYCNIHGFWKSEHALSVS